MTGHDQAPRGSDVHALSGAYAVDALDDVERAGFEAHLRQCPDCRAEVESLQEAAALLSTEPTAPPSELRDRVLAGIGQVRPLPPLMSGAATDSPSDALAERRRRRVQLGRLPLLVAAAVVLLAAVGGAFWLQPGDEPKGPGLTAAEKVLRADDATRIEKRFPDGSQAIVVVSRSEGRAVILTDDMKPAPDGKDYQLWLQTPAGELQPAGLMPDTRDATKLLDGDASRATGVGITVEPDGGSDQPTSEPIAFFSLET